MVRLKNPTKKDIERDEMREDSGLREKTTDRKGDRKKKREKRKKEKVFYDILFGYRNFNYSGEICERDPKQKF